MKIFLDSANLEEIKKAQDLGIIEGVTTNPSLIAREKIKDFKNHLIKICQTVDGPVSAEAISESAEKIIDEAKDLAKIHPNVVIKIPITAQGLKATKILSAQKIKVNMTLIFNTTQAMLAAKAGAFYISPFLGRLDDIGGSGTGILSEIITVFENYHFRTQIIAASIRHIEHIRKSALLGVHIATVPYELLDKMIKHPLTDLGIKKFLEDYGKRSHM